MTIRLIDREGTVRQLRLVVDTGSPCALIVEDGLLRVVATDVSQPTETNFGSMRSGWVQIAIPGVHLEAEVRAFGSDTVVRATKASHEAFEGLIGLPLLRMTEYGGDADVFWLREAMR